MGMATLDLTRSNQAMQRTAGRSAFYLSMAFTFNSHPHALMPSRPRSVTATLRGFSVYPERFHPSVFSPAVADLGSR